MSKLKIKRVKEAKTHTELVTGLPSSGKSYYVLDQIDPEETLWVWANNLEAVRVHPKGKDLDILELSTFEDVENLIAELSELEEQYRTIVVDGLDLVFDYYFQASGASHGMTAYGEAAVNLKQFCVRLRSHFSKSYGIVGIRESGEDGDHELDISPLARRKLLSLYGRKTLCFAHWNKKNRTPEYKTVNGYAAVNMIPPLTASI